MKRLCYLMALVLIVAGCGSKASPPLPALPAPSADINPAGFTTVIDNPYSPWIPGTRLRYEGDTEEGHEVVDIVVTNDTRTLMGVPVLAVRDTVTVGGEVIEDTTDWYAQDAAGNVWYFGEDTKEYEHGKVSSTAGSWLAGVDGALPGIFMYAKPAPGQIYRQEYRKGEAEDGAQVLSVSEHVSIGYGSYDSVIKTLEFTPLEPDAREYKYYARGVGLVLITEVGSDGRTELTSVTAP
jgi:hypothetical protein